VLIATIEVGLVAIELESREILDEFQRFVRPQFNPALTDFCKSLRPFNSRTWTVPEPIKRLEKIYGRL
jgi:inhibitor of KinA sporulation pathway (predicted exonuclease)